MTSGAHVIRCRDTGEALANKLDGGECVCKPGECEMRKLRNREGDYAKNNSEDEGFDAMGFAIGLATGFPISPRGITAGSILGAILHPTERHAAYDVTSTTPTADVQPGTPAVPVRDVDFNDNSTTAAPIDTTPVRNPDVVEPTQTAPADDYKPSYEAPPPAPEPTPAPSYEPSYSAPTPDPTPAPSYDPAPSYSAPDPSPSPSYDSGGGGFSGGGTDP